jgi:upstream activation factor subunit UAF30
VKAHDLQNPQNRREILADDKLKQVFGKNEISMFEVGRGVNEHLSGRAQTATQRKKVA